MELWRKMGMARVLGDLGDFGVLQNRKPTLSGMVYYELGKGLDSSWFIPLAKCLIILVHKSHKFIQLLYRLSHVMPSISGL